ncbi:carboxyl-terminal processing protease [Advenella incenata]|jgi:carboxyl-terminal processing protease|uniref:Carboxyl-terminal processing protease n=1 Tax=Advenella incenata TaxID=267800 RepID=A0A4V2FTZ8_9BURK|nr:carboxy terminal-processing peptidase [Advenella incenata]RZU00086.1 carboxyl-terminal processing protease [Advenella incenata]
MKLKVLATALALLATSACVYADSEALNRIERLEQSQSTQHQLLVQNSSPSADASKAPVSQKKPEKKALEPTVDQAKAAIIVANILTRFEYDKKPLDENMSHAVFKEYLKMMDPAKLYLLKSDIDEFEPVRQNIHTMLMTGRLAPAFAMFEKYRDRVEQRFDHALALLDKPFDFDVEESFDLDRKKAEWSTSEEQINDLWRKRIKNDYLRLKLAGSKDSVIVEKLKKRYINNRNQIMRMNGEDVAEMFLNAYGNSTDPHTSYYSPSSAKNFDVQISLSVDGIGAVLQKRDEYGQIREVVPGGPAAKSGKLNPGDRIVAVGQGESGPMEDVVDWRLDDIVKLIRGKRGTTVRIEIIPAERGMEGKHTTVSIVRQKVTMEDQAARYRIFEAGSNGDKRKVGIITIPSFYEDFDAKARGESNYKSLTRDVRVILEKLDKEGVDGVLLDLRNNGGGSLSEAANLSGLFLGGPNPIVQVSTAEGTTSNVRSATGKLVWNKPVGVMVNRISASASEIFAAVIQDYGRGVVIGDPTWGKGSVQTIRGLDEFLRRHEGEELGSLKWTIQKFFRVNGSSTQEKGVVPDIVFPSAFDPTELGESSYENAMPWSKIAPTKYSGYDSLAEKIGPLKTMHEQRTQQSDSWKLLLDELAYARKTSDKKVISLRYATRLEEREKMSMEQSQFEERRKKLGESDVNSFRLDDGLAAGEGNLTQELADEKKRKESLDIAIKEAANIVADLAKQK